VKRSVAVVVRDEMGRFLIVRRPDDPADPLAGLWGLPAVTLAPGEDEQSAASRAGHLKLGVRLRVGAKIGEADSPERALHLSDYEATILSGTVSVPQPGTGVTQYTECRFTDDPATLAEAAERGSLCAQVFLSAQRG
jgi:8-oxo-dGTP diphosphatase